MTLKRQGITISGFLIGCVTGAILGNAMGLSSVIFAGVAVLFYVLRMTGSNHTTILTESN
jgi:ABC-type nitrate/sulfonate/bicarbonate transport system permease component